MKFTRVVIAGALTVMAACGDGDGDSDALPAATTDAAPTSSTIEAACSPAVDEPLDPNSARHVIPGGPEPTYQSDPPTSGPHQTGSLPSGAVNEPIPRPKQVGLLEGGAVLLQHKGLPAEAVAALEARARGTEIVVAPNADLPAPLVLTAWTFKQTCTRLDEASVTAFIDAHLGSVDADH